MTQPATAMEQPKKPVGGAFGIFMSENRSEYMKALSGKKVSEVSKMGGEAWKKLSDEEKVPYQKKYEEAKARFDKDMADFLAAGGEKTKGPTALRSEKRKAKDKKKKDVNEPKKPAGGGYGVYLAENRVDITKALPAGHKITDVSKEASKQWSALSDADKKPYQDRFLKKQDEYKAAMEEYKKSLPADAEEEEEEKKPKEQSPRKRKATAGGEKQERQKITPPKAKKPRQAAKQALVIDADVLKKAEGLGLDASLRNLMSREDVMAKEYPHAKMLSALEKNEGLVNKAKYALLGA